MAGRSPYSFAALILAVNVFTMTAVAAALGFPAAPVALGTLVEVLKPGLAILTVYRVVRSPPEGAGQLRACWRWLRTAGDADVTLAPALLVMEVVAAAVLLVGFAGVVFFADFGRWGTHASLAVLLGYGDVYVAGSVAALAVYSAGVFLWTATWVLEGLEVTGTKPAPFRE